MFRLQGAWKRYALDAMLAALLTLLESDSLVGLSPE